MRRIRPCIIVVLAGLTLACRHSSRSTIKRLSAEQVADRAAPATVNMVVEYEATIEVADLDVDSNKLIADVKRRLSSCLPPSRKEALAGVVSTLLGDPGSYLVANGKTRTAKSKTAHPLGSGTGGSRPTVM